MKRFKDIKISAKIIISLLIVTSFTGIIGATGLFGLNRVDDSIGYVIGQSWSRHYLAGANNTLQRARISVRDIILGAVIDDDEQIENAFASIVANMAILENYFNSFNESNSEADIQEAFDLGRSLYENELIPIVLGIHGASVERDLETALELLGRCVITSDIIISSFDYGMDLALTYSENVADDAHNLTNLFFWLSIIMLSIALLCSLFLAFYLSAMITRNLKTLMRLAEDTSNGNLYTNFPNMPNDEIGELSIAFLKVKGVILTLTKELERVSDETLRGKAQARADETAFSGAYQEVIININRLLENYNKYIDLLPISITLLDADKKIMYANKYLREQGFDLIGKRLEDSFAPEAVEKLLIGFDSAIKIGKSENMKLERLSPIDKQIITEEFLVIPIFDNKNQVSSFIMPSYNITHIVKSQKISEKIREYQDFEALSLRNNLNLGLNQGVLTFEYALRPSDEDTAASAATYKLIADTIKSSLDFIKNYVNDITELLKQIANKDFDVKINREYIGDFSVIKKSIISMTDSISLLISNMQSTADGIDSGAARIAGSLQEFLTNFENQKNTINDMRNYVASLNEKTQKNVQGTDNAKNLSNKMQKVAQTGRRQMQDLSSTMEEIKRVSDETAKIAKVVEDIAFQTDLLALNAAVEAARAGEHGRGFSVVAEEVRNLANRSAQAAKETSSLLEDSRNRIITGESMSDKTLEAFMDIVNITTEVGKLISEIANASNEQAQDIYKIQIDVDEVFKMVETDTQTAKENAAGTDELSAFASDLNALLKQFKAKKLL